MNDKTSVSNLKKIRADVGFVFQQFNLFPHLTILENITLAPIKVNGLSKSEAEDKAMALLNALEYQSRRTSIRRPLRGQQQQVAIAEKRERESYGSPKLCFSMSQPQH